MDNNSVNNNNIMNNEDAQNTLTYTSIDFMERGTTPFQKQMLKKFLDGLDTDVTVIVSNRKMRAHRSILTSRCSYFAHSLVDGVNVVNMSFLCDNKPSSSVDGGNIKNETPKIYSIHITHFVICHIYAGVTAVPSVFNILDVLSLANDLDLYSLKDAISKTLVVDNNYFLNSTIAQIKMFMYNASQCDSDIIFDACAESIAANFSRVWLSKDFLDLPRSVKTRCLTKQLSQFNIFKIVETLEGCATVINGQTIGEVSEEVCELVRKLIQEIGKYVSADLNTAIKIIVNNKNSLSCLKTVEECITVAIQAAPECELAKSHKFIEEQLCLISGEEPWYHVFNNWQILLCNMLIRIYAVDSRPQIWPSDMPMKIKCILLKMKIRNSARDPEPCLDLSMKHKAAKKTFKNRQSPLGPHRQQPL